MTTIETTTPDTTPRSRTDPVRAVVDLVLMVALGAVFVRVAVWPTLVHHYPFAVGPDMPVYLWWSRVGAAEGISLVGERPGTPALIPTVAKALGIGLVPAVAGVQYALMPASPHASRGWQAPSSPAPGPRSSAAATSRTWRSSPRSSRPPPPSRAARVGEPSRRRCSWAAAASPTPSSSWSRRRSWWPRPRGRGAAAGAGSMRAPTHTTAGTPSASSPRWAAAPGWSAPGSSPPSSVPRGSRGTPRWTRCSGGQVSGPSSAASTSIAWSRTGVGTRRS